MKYTILSITLIFALLFTGCSNAEHERESSNTSVVPYVIESESAIEDTAEDENTAMSVPTDSAFSERDLSGTYDESSANTITLNTDSITSDSGNVDISGTTAVIRTEGVYIISGILENGSLIVDATQNDKIQIVLNDTSIHSDTYAPICVKQADKVFITLASESENTLSNGGVFENADDESVDAVIFSKDDLTINGEGSLNVYSPGGHGIVSKDELTVCGGDISVESLSHGIAGKDSVCITNAAINITSGKDGIHAENKDDESLGYLYIAGGDFTLQSDGDCISAAAALQIDSGTFNLVSGGGSINAEMKSSDAFPMGGRMPHGGMGEMPPRGSDRGMMAIMPLYADVSALADATEETISMKAIKCDGSLSIHGGTFIIDAADDAVHSNKDIHVYNGEFTIKTGDDGFHADASLEFINGSVTIEESYEGFEGQSIRINSGNIIITASDDGLNAAGGTDQSGFGGMRGGDMFAADPNSFIEINGGTLYVKASGDGIDSNGSLTVTGGNITLCGPTVGDTAVLDYASTGTITGGTFIGTGSSMMAQTLSSDSQGVIALSVGNQSAGTEVILSCSDGTELLSVSPNMDFAVVLFSCPEMKKGESYTVTIGSVSKSFEAQ